jgi:hypothetical protein
VIIISSSGWLAAIIGYGDSQTKNDSSPWFRFEVTA